MLFGILMLYNCLVVLLSCIISTVGCIAINILFYLILFFILFDTVSEVRLAVPRMMSLGLGPLVMEACREYTNYYEQQNTPLHILYGHASARPGGMCSPECIYNYVVLKAMLDSAGRSSLWLLLQRLGILVKFIDVMKKLHNQSFISYYITNICYGANQPELISASHK